MVFTYQLKPNDDGSLSGPAGVLPSDAVTGLYDQDADLYYGSANISDLGVLAEFHAKEITQESFDAFVARMQEAAATMMPEDGPVVYPADYHGFLVALDERMTFDQLKTLTQIYPAFISWCEYQNAPRVQECILDAKASHPDLMTDDLYAVFKTAAEQFHLPITI